jgi:hypothetical protein
MSISIDIDRLSISLQGVSPGVAEAAMVGLDDELRRRLGNLGERSFTNGDLGVLRIGPVEHSLRNDPAMLRGLIADRLIDALSNTTTQTEGGA